MEIKTVLHIDDDKTIGRIVQIILQRMAGWHVDFVTSSEDALAYLENNRPDVILLDIMMPNIDGLSAFKNMQSQKLADKIPVILISAKPMKDQRDNYLAMGLAGLIQKPFDPGSLCDEIQSIVDRFTQVQSEERELAGSTTKQIPGTHT